MAYKQIVVNVANPLSDQRMDLAAALAAQHGGNLLGRYIRFEASSALPSQAHVRMSETAITAWQQSAATDDQDATHARASFDAALRTHKVEGDFHIETAQGRTLTQCLLEDARCADVTVLGKPADGPHERSLVQLIEEAGTPVLVVPDGVARTPGTSHVAVAWNGTRESARAVHGALPLLVKAGRATVLTVRREEDLAASAQRLRTWLERHGVACDVKHDHSNLKAADALVSRTEDLAADALVMGAYGRSRLKEMATGGATTGRLVRQATVPLLMAQ